jgi:Ca-activated chloride channel homolog
MTEKLDFSLPQKKSRGSAVGTLTVLLLIVLIILAAINLADRTDIGRDSSGWQSQAHPRTGGGDVIRAKAGIGDGLPRGGEAIAKAFGRGTATRTGLSILLFAGCLLAGVPAASLAATGSAQEMLRQGNRLYGESRFNEAVNKYNDALVEQPQAVEPKFNKANSFYRLDDLGEAMDLYQEVAAASKDMSLVAKAKYNLGNCFFQRGTKQRDSNLQKALEDMETSIAQWRQVLDLDPKNTKAAKNIEVARLTIKDILDQMKQQQQQDPNQPNQQQQQQEQDQGQQQNQSRQDPNQPQDPNQAQGAQPKPDPNEPQPEPQPEQGQQDKPQEMKDPPDATAQEIIDAEQRQKKEREAMRQRSRYQQVEKDW